MFGPWFAKNPTPVLTSGDLVLRAPKVSDFEQWRDLRLQSYAFLRPFEPRWSQSDLTRAVYGQRLRRHLKLAREGSEFTFFIFRQTDEGEQLAGGLTLSNIRLRVSLHASLGYWMGERHAGQGIMTRAVGALLPFVFDDLHLQRLHAACLPHNDASRRVLEKNGFKHEGFADHYLKIDGKWQDHVLYGLSRERYADRRPPA